MDGENNGNPYEQMDDLGGSFPPIFGLTPKYTIAIDPSWVMVHQYKRRWDVPNL